MDEALRMKVLENAARESLRLTMRFVSEEVYSAGWYSGIEYDLWAYAIGLKQNFWIPRCMTSATYQQDILNLANAVGGWWHWSQDSATEVFTPMEDWLEMFDFCHGNGTEPVLTPAQVWNG